jgi:hypothetical protein
LSNAPLLIETHEDDDGKSNKNPKQYLYLPEKASWRVEVPAGGKLWLA